MKDKFIAIAKRMLKVMGVLAEMIMNKIFEKRDIFSFFC